MALLVHLLLVVFSGYGLAILLVEKKRQWPIRRNVLILKKVLGKVHVKLPRMLNCTVCTSFWSTFFAEVIVLLVSLLLGYPLYWTWPLSGFITTGLTWTIMDILISLATIANKK